MGKYVKGDVVVCQFPFSDLTTVKRRPALCISSLAGHGDSDYIVCAITSKSYEGSCVVNLTSADFELGEIEHDSYIQVAHIFTANDSLLLRKLGSVKSGKLREVIEKLKELLDS